MVQKHEKNLMEDSCSIFAKTNSGIRTIGLVVLTGAVIGAGACGCNKEEPNKESSPKESAIQAEQNSGRADTSLCEANAFAYSGGSGTKNDPYQIATVTDLIELGIRTSDYDKHFVLTTDIDLSGRTFRQAVIAPDTQDVEFAGHFDGQGHVIKNLRIRGDNCLGLFGEINLNAMITNLGLESADVNGVGDVVGGLVARSGGGRIEESYCTGKISGDSYVGGLTGNSWGNISSSYSTATVNGTGEHIGGLVQCQVGDVSSSHSTGEVHGDEYVGGLAGDCSGHISSCYCTGVVKGNALVGGLVGRMGNGSISMSYSRAKVTGKDNSTGGLVGYSDYDRILSCRSTGPVRGGIAVGGLVGRKTEGSISSSYSISDVQGNNGVGGLVGHNGAGISSCYSAGRIRGRFSVGGLVGINSGAVGSSFWDKQTSGQSLSDGGAGLNTAQMEDIRTYLHSDWGWDFKDIWYMPANSHPGLAWERISEKQ